MPQLILNLRRLLLPLAVFGLLVQIVHWGGSARGGPLLYLGVGALAGLIGAFALLLWWLFFSALPAQVARPPARSPRARRVVAALVLLSGMLFVTGGFWDEVWHRRYGGFGEDFLWPPHLLLYGSLALIALFAGGGLLLAMGGSGGLRQRFRAEPLPGLLGLTSAYLVASLPSDQLWHTIYGKDLTAWSLPHVLLASGFALVMLSAVALALGGPVSWRGLRGMRLPDALALGLVACAAQVLLQVGTAEWEDITVIGGGGDSFRRAFWERPEWLYPVVVVSIAVFCGMFALHATRRVGAASSMGALVLLMRLGLILALGAQAADVRMGYLPHLLALPPLIALDVWYAARLRRAGNPATLLLGSLLAAAALLAAGLPLIAGALVYPRVNAGTLPGMILWSLLAAPGAGWAGARFGAWLGALGQAPASAEAPAEMAHARATQSVAGEGSLPSFTPPS